MAYKPNIRRLVDDRDIYGLIKALRYPDDPEIRARAARALGKIGNVKTVESLIRSHLQDPDPGAQQAALDALHQIIGSEAELAISAYALPDETWIEDKNVSSEQLQEDWEGSDSGEEKSPLEEDLEEGGDDLEEESEEDLDEEGQEESVKQGLETGEISWDENDIHVLVATFRLDHSRKKRLKAIQALSLIPDTRAIDALASIALWSEEKRLCEAAREALSVIYGDSLEEVLQSYRQASQEAGLAEDEAEGDKEDDEDDEDDEDVDYEDDEDYDDDEEEVGEADDAGLDEEDQYLPVSSPGQPSPVIREEKPGWFTYLLLGLLFVVILVAVVHLLAR